LSRCRSAFAGARRGRRDRRCTARGGRGPIAGVLDEIPPTLVDLALWIAEYYGSTPARALELVAPRACKRRGAPRRRLPASPAAAPERLTAEQAAAVEAIVGR
jgi:hypothetical protein